MEYVLNFNNKKVGWGQNAVLRIAYSNQKWSRLSVNFPKTRLYKTRQFFWYLKFGFVRILDTYCKRMVSYLEIPMAAELKEQPELSIVKLTGARAHQVHQVQVMLQIGENFDLTEQSCQLRSVQGIVDSFDSNLGQ